MPLALQRRTQGYFPCRAALADNAVALTTTVSNSIALVLNAAPTSTSVTPMDGTTFTAPANVTLSATASDSDGSISQVDFYNGTTLIGTVLSGSAGDAGSGYTATWSNVAPGTYQLTAKATDNNGARVTTTAVTVTVNATAATIYYIHPDHLGTPRVITTSDATNTKVWEWGNSDAFGANLPNEDPSATGTAFKYNLRFPGQYFDQETGTHYNYFRDYDPATGRYIESDPIGLKGGINTYGYVSSQPLNFSDPNGLQIIPMPVPVPGIPLPGIPKPNDPSDLYPDPDKPGWTLPTIPVPKWFPDWLKAPQQCREDREEECLKKLQEDDALCVAIAGPRYGKSGIAICKKSAMQRYSECLRSGVSGINTPLHGVSTPL